MVHMCHYMLQPLLVLPRPLLFFQRQFAWKLHSIWEIEYRPRCQEGARSAQREIFRVGRPGFLNTFPRSLKFFDIWISGHASRVNVIFVALDGKPVLVYPFPDLEQAEKLMCALEEYIQVYMQDAFCFLGFDRTDSCICAACRAT